MNVDHQLVLARCYVALCEVDYDLREWRLALAALEESES